MEHSRTDKRSLSSSISTCNNFGIPVNKGARIWEARISPSRALLPDLRAELAENASENEVQAHVEYASVA